MEITTATLPLKQPVRPSARRVRRWALVAAVLAITFLAYGGTLNYEFVVDDFAQIVYNRGIQSWQNLPHVFEARSWSIEAGGAPSYYRPVVAVWSIVNYQWFGTNPMPWHFGGVLLHLLATALVFYLARRMLNDDLGAAMAALLFGIHPIHLESVAWVTGATDTMMAIFCLGSFLAYLRFRDRTTRRWLWYGFSLVLYALGCLVKEPSIVLPGIIAMNEWLFSPEEAPSRRIRRVASTIAGYGAVAAAYLAQRSIVLHGLGNQPLHLPVWKMPLSWPELLWFYIHKIAWPVRLALFYHVQPLTTATVNEFWLPLLAVVAACVAITLAIRRLPQEPQNGVRARAVAWMSVVWFVLPLLPVLDIYPLHQDELAHDRYLYLPCAGFAVLVALAIRRIDWGKARIFGAPAAQVGIFVLISSALALGTVQQSVYWGNDLLLCYRALQISPTSPNLTRWLGDALLERGHFEEGIRIHEQIARRNPEFWWSHFQLGHAYYKVGRYVESEQQLLEAAQLNSATPQLLTYLAAAEMKNQHFAEAEGTLRRAIEMQPNTSGWHYLLGMLFEQQQRWPEAVAAFEQELAIDPNQPKVRNELDFARQRVR